MFLLGTMLRIKVLLIFRVDDVYIEALFYYLQVITIKKGKV